MFRLLAYFQYFLGNFPPGMRHRVCHNEKFLPGDNTKILMDRWKVKSFHFLIVSTVLFLYNRFMFLFMFGDK